MQPIDYDYAVEISGPNMLMGRLTPDKPPVLTVNSGDIVKIETINEIGADGVCTSRQYCQAQGIDLDGTMAGKLVCALEELLQTDPQADGPWSIHRVTGPIAIRGAQPGDVLEVRILDTRLTIPWGNAMVFPHCGTVPDLVKTNAYHLVPFDRELLWGSFCGMRIPLHPFFGIMAVAPPHTVHAAPPGPFGGNMDNKRIVKGTSLYLPVQVSDALFYVGDPHAAQGNGEVSICAIETAALTGIFQFVLHKNVPLTMPFIQTPTHYISVGLNCNLNDAVRQATEQSIAFLQYKKGLNFNDALMFCSIAVDYEITQAVDQVLGVHGMIRKDILDEDASDFWNADGGVFYRNDL